MRCSVQTEASPPPRSTRRRWNGRGPPPQPRQETLQFVLASTQFVLNPPSGSCQDVIPRTAT